METATGLFFNTVSISYALLLAMNKSLKATLVKISTGGDGPLFHSFCDSIIPRKLLPMQSIFHCPKQMEVGRH